MPKSMDMVREEETGRSSSASRDRLHIVVWDVLVRRKLGLIVRFGARRRIDQSTIEM